jgi:hypothetical protein
MVDASSHDDNPYASPVSTAVAGIEPDGRIWPSKAPADLLDIVIGIAYVVIALTVVLVLPSVAALATLWLIKAGPGHVPALVSFVMLLPTSIWYVWLLSSIVISVSVDEDGLHFQRRFRSPDDWAWDSVTAIRPASRREVAWDGWIRPLFNPRERTICMSALGHYRIQGKTDYCFFPPKNPEAFVEAIARYRPDLLHQ